MTAPERRALASRIPGLAAIAPQLQRAARRSRAIPLLYVEFVDLDESNAKPAAFRAACKQATAAALKSSLGTVLRRHDLVAAGRGGRWFIAALTGRQLRSGSARSLDADLGLAAERLRLALHTALQHLGTGSLPVGRVGVRCGWNVLEPARADEVLGALRHAIRGAALVARVEERRALVLAAVTHELRTPLTAIIGFTERLQAARVSPAQRSHWLGMVAAEGRRLHRLIDGLIDVGAWNAGGLQLRPMPCAVQSVVRRAVTALAPEARRRSVRLRVSGAARASIDPERLLQILINLLDNAVRHSPSGKQVDTQIRTDGSHVIICVRDSGPGFSRAQRAAVGAPFRAGTNGKTGLGLAISKILAEAHGGYLELGNRASGGSVSVVLPLERPDPAGRDHRNVRAGANRRL